MTIEMARAQVSALKDQWKTRARERRDAWRLERMARGDYIGDVPAMPNEPQWHQAKSYRPPFAPNLLGQALRELDTLYSEEPHRTVDPETEQEWAESAVWAFGLGLSTPMARVDALTRLHGTALLYPAWKPSQDAARDLRAILGGEAVPFDPDGDGVEVLALGRWCFELLANEFDPRHAEAVVVKVGQRQIGDTSMGRVVDVHHYWDRQFFAVLEDFKPQPMGEAGEAFLTHGMDDHPFVVTRNDEGELTTYAEGWGGKDLRPNLLAVASQWREYGWTAKLQRGQPWANGEVENATLAPDAIIQVSATGTFGIAGNAANLPGIRGAVQDHGEIVSRSLGLPSRTFAISEQRNAQSGIAIALDRAAILDDRRRRQKLARHWEQAIFRKASAAYNAARGTAHDGSATTTFRPLPMVVSFDERLKRIELLARLGWIAPPDALRELYPGETTAEIEARLNRAEEYALRVVDATSTLS